LSIDGTSASAAIVAGVAAFIKAAADPLDPPSNGVIVGRLARTADPAGTQEQTGNGRINMARALADTEAAFVQPEGTPPGGSGGPFIGPYIAAARTLNVTFSGTGGGSVAVTVDTGTISFSGCTGATGSGTASVNLVGTCSLTLSGNTAVATLTATPSGSTFD